METSISSYSVILSKSSLNWQTSWHSMRGMNEPFNAECHEPPSHAAGPGQQPNNPLHAITLKMMLTELVAHFGWDELGRLTHIRCFTHEPSINSSLKVLRKTPWAREKVEALYLNQKTNPL